MVRSKSKDLTISFLLFILGLLIITPIFLMFISSLKDDICSNMKTFVVLSLNLVNLAMNFQYSFYLVSIDLKKYDFNNGSLSVQFELIIDFR